MPHVIATAETAAPLLFIDTAGCDCEEDDYGKIVPGSPAGGAGGGGAGGGGASISGGKGAGKGVGARSSASDVLAVSRSNAAEARLVRAYVVQLRAAGVRDADIGVITPYNAQVELLRDALWGSAAAGDTGGGGGGDAGGGGGGGAGGGGGDGAGGGGGGGAGGGLADLSSGRLEIGTVDGFQGREKEVRRDTGGEGGGMAAGAGARAAATRRLHGTNGHGHSQQQYSQQLA